MQRQHRKQTCGSITLAGSRQPAASATVAGFCPEPEAGTSHQRTTPERSVEGTKKADYQPPLFRKLKVRAFAAPVPGFARFELTRRQNGMHLGFTRSRNLRQLANTPSARAVPGGSTRQSQNINPGFAAS
jgi:hypothetical protein